jgi:L-iditol 2-dehydrogenase
MTCCPAPNSFYETAYDPDRVLKSTEFRVLKADDPVLADKTANIACAYNPAHEVHLIQKPAVEARKGEAVVHVRATGICG